MFANTSNIATQIAGQLATASSIMINVSGNVEDMDYEMIQSDISALTTMLSQMAPALKLVAGLSDNGDELMECALALTRATNEMINTCQRVAMGDVASRNELHANGQQLAREAAIILESLGR